MSYIQKCKKPVQREQRKTGFQKKKSKILSTSNFTTSQVDNQQFVIPFTCPKCIKRAKRILKKHYQVKRRGYDLIVTGNIKAVRELLAKKGFVEGGAR